ncbi:50S ribosomal protein L29 [Helicobacter trogontum]|uniref:Large ribosomal subunit protein uL29 n=1 Tax=Helicobacter trogontum TaxID=50960 RepID=A0A4V6HZK3_9HELI|nr:50S ribosomal protein L29 [Helicobacter trogontum]TLD84842.1 50S ribosomal protein L29 [Helicobacter trogontum]
MKYTDLKDKELSELRQLLKDKKTELFTLKIKLKTAQLTKPSEISIVRKDIARISTAISAKFNLEETN